MVLDQATASVDSLTEQRVQDATKELLREGTVLVVAHRLGGSLRRLAHAPRFPFDLPR